MLTTRLAPLTQTSESIIALRSATYCNLSTYNLAPFVSSEDCSTCGSEPVHPSPLLYYYLISLWLSPNCSSTHTRSAPYLSTVV